MDIWVECLIKLDNFYSIVTYLYSFAILFYFLRLSLFLNYNFILYFTFFFFFVKLPYFTSSFNKKNYFLEDDAACHVVIWMEPLKKHTWH
jgi:hypothetical protein